MSIKTLTNDEKNQIILTICNDPEFIKESYPENAANYIKAVYKLTDNQIDKIIVKCSKLLKNLTI